MSEANSARSQRFDVIIIGAGLSGMYAVYRLRKLGLSVRAFDEAGDVGGTWWWNRYPGARVDSPGAPFYGYTFSTELAQEWNWEETQPDQPAILAYLRHVAGRFDLRKDIQLETRIKSAHWDANVQLWKLVTSAEQVIEAPFLISAVGTLSASFLPDIPGVKDFAGEVVHTGHWPEAGLSFEGKRVGVIGTGSSGVQVIPFIARQAKEVFVFQRTPQYVIPGRNRALDPDFAATAKERWSHYREQLNATGRPFPTPRRLAVATDETERQAIYEEAWRRGGLGLASTFSDHMISLEANSYVGEFVRSKIAETVSDPAVAQKLMPTFLFGGKRLILGEGYYETFNRPNVRLIDLREEPIELIDATSIRTNRETIPLDVLVFATGYDAITGAILRLDPVGPGGPLRTKWQDGVKTYLGMAIHGFPNMFMIHGPQSPSVKFHMGLGAEKQVNWIADLITWMQRRNYVEAQPTEAVESAWGEKVTTLASTTLFPLTDSWFSGANIPGKHREFMIHLDGPAYHQDLMALADTKYQGFTFKTSDRLPVAALEHTDNV